MSNTAIDKHFSDAEQDPEFDLEEGRANALPEEPKSKGSKVGTIAMLGIAAVALTAGGYVVMQRFSGVSADQQQVLVDTAPMAQQGPQVTEEALVPADTPSQALTPQPPASDPAMQVPMAPTAPAPSPAPHASADQQVAPALPDRVGTNNPQGQALSSAPSPVPPTAAVQPVAPISAHPAAPAHVASNDAEKTKLAASLGEANQKISRLEGEVQKLRAELAASRQSAAKPAVTRVVSAAPKPAPAKTVAKPAAKPADKAIAQVKPVDAKPSDSASGRTDFRIYAMRDGQAWVQDLKTRETIPAVPGSMLPDGSKVTKINETQGVISTSAGEIRYTSLNRTN